MHAGVFFFRRLRREDACEGVRRCFFFHLSAGPLLSVTAKERGMGCARNVYGARFSRGRVSWGDRNLSSCTGLVLQFNSRCFFCGLGESKQSVGNTHVRACKCIHFRACESGAGGIYALYPGLQHMRLLICSRNSEEAPRDKKQVADVHLQDKTCALLLEEETLAVAAWKHRVCNWCTT